MSSIIRLVASVFFLLWIICCISGKKHKGKLDAPCPERWCMKENEIETCNDRHPPRTSCSTHFRYECWCNQWIGIFSVHHNSSNPWMTMIAGYSLDGKQILGEVGSLVRHPSSMHVDEGQAIEYITCLYSLHGSLAKLTKLVINDNLVCEAEAFPEPSTTLMRRYNLTNVFPVYPCGKEGFVPLLYGGEEFERGRFPWLVVIAQKLSLVFEPKCGGSLVSRRTVVTAAHCMFDIDTTKIHVYLGRHDLGVGNEIGAVTMGVKRIIMHPDYRLQRSPEVDVGLLVLEFPVEYSQFIWPICMWNNDDEIGSDSGQQGTVAGWGIDEHGQQPMHPKIVQVFTVSQAACLRNMIGAMEYITDRTICAGNNMTHGPCFGDSGSGLLFKRSNRWKLRAVVSFGSRDGNRCDLKTYVLYCDLAKHIDWIQAHIVHYSIQ